MDTSVLIFTTYLFAMSLFYLCTMVHDIRHENKEIKRDLFKMKMTIDKIEIHNKYRKD